MAGTANTHFALIVSVRPGHNVSIKITSIEEKLFSFHLQITSCLRSAVVHLERPVLMQIESLDIQAGSSSVGARSERMEGGRRGVAEERLIERR